MKKMIAILVAGLIAFLIGCGSQDLFVDVCSEKDQWCYMENGKDTGTCVVFKDGLACSDCLMCVGCSRIDLNTCEQTVCKVNTVQELDLGIASFAHMRFDENIDADFCAELKELGKGE